MASIRTRTRKDGTTSYQVRWRDPNTGSEVLTFDNPGEAEALQRLLDANGQSLRASERVLDDAGVDGPTVREVMLKHIEQLTNVGPYQLKRYRTSIDEHFTQLGRLKVKTVEHGDVVHWLHQMRDKGLKPKTIANHHGFLSSAMNTAVRLRYRDHNPCKGVKLPKHDATEDEMGIISPEQWGRIIANMDPLYVPFFQFLLGTGLRFGEATALKGTDFKLDGNPPTVKIVRAWKEDEHGQPYIGPPKTKKARRVVSLAPSTVETVRPLVESRSGFVFTTLTGAHIRSSQAHKIWGPACAAAGIALEDRPRIHSIRHMHASMMLQAGMDMYQLSNRLGHTSINITVGTYSHLMPQAHFLGAEAASKALEGFAS